MDATGPPGKQSALLTLLGQISTVGVMLPVLPKRRHYRFWCSHLNRTNLAIEKILA